MAQPEFFPFKEKGGGSVGNSEIRSYYQYYTRQTDIMKWSALEVTYMEELIFSENNWDKHACNVGNTVLLRNRRKKYFMCLFWCPSVFTLFILWDLQNF